VTELANLETELGSGNVNDPTTLRNAVRIIRAVRELVDDTTVPLSGAPVTGGIPYVILRSVPGPFFNVVSDYMAVGDGATDDTVAIQAALTAARTAGGGVVYFPPGTYRLSADLEVGAKTWLCGQGRGATLLKRDTTTATVAVIKNFDRGGYTDTDIHISDMTVWRNGEATTANTPLDNAIQLVGVTRASVRDCRVRGGAKGIHFYGCLQWDATGNWVDTFVDNAIAANPSPTSTNTTGYGRMIGNYCATPTASGFSLGSSSLFTTQGGVLIANNVVQDAATNAVECGYNATALVFVSVIDNLFRWSGASNVNNNVLFTDRSDDILVEGNLIEKGSINFAVNTPASTLNHRCSVIANILRTGNIILRDISQGVCVGNFVTNYTGRGIVIASCNDLLVTGNEVSGCTLDGFQFTTDGAGQANARLRVTNNVVFNNGTAGTAGQTYGFTCDGGDKIEFVGNRAYDAAGGSGTQTHGLYINATTNYVDSGNDCAGNKTAARATFTTSPARRGCPGDVFTHDEISSNVATSASTESTAGTIISATACIFDGTTPVMVEFYSPGWTHATASTDTLFVLYEGSSSIGLLGDIRSSATATGQNATLNLRRRLTPGSGSKTYSVRAYSGAGTAITVTAGTGVSGTFMPAFIRIVAA
jgi:hypothetical protein